MVASSIVRKVDTRSDRMEQMTVMSVEGRPFYRKIRSRNFIEGHVVIFGLPRVRNVPRVADSQGRSIICQFHLRKPNLEG